MLHRHRAGYGNAPARKEIRDRVHTQALRLALVLTYFLRVMAQFQQVLH